MTVIFTEFPPFHPVSKKLFFADNGRDWLGDDSPSCELNRVDSPTSFYGFPYKHSNNVVDPEYGHIKTGFNFIDPILNLGAHVAPTGIAFYTGDMFPSNFKNNLLITLHGSWNRSKKVGYKVIRVIFDNEGNVIESKDFIALGVATKIGFKIIPFSFLSIGIDLQANINLENTVFIPFISVEIGKLRY